MAWRYERRNQKPKIEEQQTMWYPKNTDTTQNTENLKIEPIQLRHVLQGYMCVVPAPLMASVVLLM